MAGTWKECWILAWMHLRKPTSVRIEPASVFLNDSNVYSVRFTAIEVDEPNWLFAKLPLSKLTISFRDGDKPQCLSYIGTEKRVDSLETALTEFVTKAIAALHSRCTENLTALEAAKEALYASPAYVRYSHARAFAEKRKPDLTDLAGKLSWLGEAGMLSDAQRADIAQFNSRVESLRPYIEEWESKRTKHNSAFIAHFSDKEADYFRTVESSALTGDQIRSCLVFEDATLVVAAAGSGKSSSIVGKIGFALRAKLFRDDQVLALAYNRKAATSLKERLSEKLKDALGREIHVASKTFHGFGLGTLVDFHGKGYEPRVLKEEDEEEHRFIKDVIANLYQNNANFQLALADWLLKAAYEDPQPVGTSDDLEECAKRYEACCRERIQARKDSDRKAYEPTIPTYDPKIYVRSLQERGIANWLLLHGISFEYERADWDGARRLNQQRGTAVKGKGRPLSPDFTYLITKTLPDSSTVTIRVVHEHFALDAGGNAPDWIGGKKYVGHASAKRTMYTAWMRESERARKERVRFIETHSAHFYDGSIFDRLTALLRNEGIAAGTPIKAVQDKALKSFRESSELERLIIDFVLSFKESGYEKADITARADRSAQPYRAALFLKVAFQVFDAYQRALRDANKIDYSDMLREAIKVLSNGSTKVPYRFILVDEFQDISRLRADLVRAVLNQAPEESIVFCVGDDWQTINRFSGSDVAIFTGISKYFDRYTERVDLPKTFRCAQGIANVSRSLVMKNPGQLYKAVTSNNPIIKKTVRVVEHGSTAAERRTALVDELNRIAIEGPILRAELARLLEKEKPKDVPTVQILRRTQSDVTAPQGLDDEFLDSLVSKYRGKLKISRMSAHGAKGLEADFAILPGLDSGFQGFPDERPPEWLLDLVLPRLADLVEEERRLFYVGLTRARHQAIVLTAAEKPSEFVLELASLRDAGDAIEWISYPEVGRTPCPMCQKGSLVIPNPKLTRRSCTRSVRCGYKEKEPAPNGQPPLTVA